MAHQVEAETPASRRVPGQSSDPIIHTEQLGKKFGNEYAVRGVSLDVPKGSIFGFIGPSGSGKTTTIRMLAGYYAPSEGEIRVFNRPPTRFTQSMRERIGYMPQLFVLYPSLTVWENLNFVSSIYGMTLFRGKLLDSVLDFVELREHKNKLARDISGGMQRRLSLAATLVHDPELIFLDEPTAGIDPVLRQKFWDHYRELKQEGRTLFITTQYVSEAAYCDLVGVMGEGRLLVVDTPAGLRYKAYGGDMVDVRMVERMDYRMEQKVRELPFVKRVQRIDPTNVRIVVDESSTAIPALLDLYRENNLAVESIEEFVPPFDDVFVEIVRRQEKNA